MRFVEALQVFGARVLEALLEFGMGGLTCSPQPFLN